MDSLLDAVSYPYNASKDAMDWAFTGVMLRGLVARYFKPKFLHLKCYMHYFLLVVKEKCI